MKDLILQIPAIVIFSLFMAIILNQKMTGRAVFRAIFFIPVILSTGIIDSVSKGFESIENMTSQGAIDTNTGSEGSGLVSALDIATLLEGIKLGSGLVDFVTTLVNGIFDIVSRSGVQMLIFLSGLQSISPSIYESCEIEGASAWEIFWKVTLPMISPMILVNAIYTIIDAFTMSDNKVMQLMEDARNGKEIPTSTYSPAGVAAAEAWVYLLLVLALILVVALIMKTVVFYQRRD
jgi:ABC-type sugar transport system permease subunit